MTFAIWLRDAWYTSATSAELERCPFGRVDKYINVRMPKSV